MGEIPIKVRISKRVYTWPHKAFPVNAQPHEARSFFPTKEVPC